MATDTLPPGPTASLTRQTVQFWRRPEPYLHAARARYGDVFTARVLPAGAVVFVADAALVKQIFAAPTDLFHAGEGNRILEPVMGSRSILLLDEDEHLRRRKLMLPAFHGDAVRRLVETMRELTAAEVDRWPVGEPFALLPRTNALTLEIILRTVFGVAEGERLDRLRALMPRVTHFPLWLMLMWVRPSWGACRRGAATSAARAGRRAAARRDRRAARAPDLDERPDVLSMLVRARDADGGSLDDRELRDQLMTLLLAGHETTATGLAWTFERVLRDPAIQERLATAVRDDDDAYLDAVVKESLRVRPVIDRVGGARRARRRSAGTVSPPTRRSPRRSGSSAWTPRTTPTRSRFAPSAGSATTRRPAPRGCRSAAGPGAAWARRSPRPRCARSSASSSGARSCAPSTRRRSASSAGTSRSPRSWARASCASLNEASRP
jgi:cytochrome P450